MANAFTSRAHRQRVLKWCRGPFNCWSQLLCDGACDQACDDVACHNTLTPSVGFCNAVILPMRTTCKISSGMSPRAKLWHMLQNRSASREDSSTGRKCSAVIPEGLQPLPISPTEHRHLFKLGLEMASVKLFVEQHSRQHQQQFSPTALSGNVRVNRNFQNHFQRVLEWSTQQLRDTLHDTHNLK